MPHVAFAALPAYGHVFPLVPLALATQARGARVTFATGGGFLGRLPVPTTRGAADSVGDLAGATMSRFPEVADDMATRWVPAFFGVVQAQTALEPLRRLWTDDRPDLVVYETTHSAARVVADDLGIPAVMCGIGHISPMMTRLSGVTRRFLDDPSVPPWAPLDVAPPPVEIYLDPMPAALQQGESAGIRTRRPLRPVAWEEPQPDFVPPWGEGDRPRIYVTLGTVFSGGGWDARESPIVGLVREAAEVGDVLVAVGPTGDPAAVHDPARGIHAARMVPQATVLRQADLVVHHGGSGTTLGAAAAGIPQIVVPQGADQFVNAAAVASAGIGLSFPGERPPGAVGDALARLRDDDAYRAAARRVADDIAAMPGPDDVAAELVADDVAAELVADER